MAFQKKQNFVDELIFGMVDDCPENFKNSNVFEDEQRRNFAKRRLRILGWWSTGVVGLFGIVGGLAQFWPFKEKNKSLGDNFVPISFIQEDIVNKKHNNFSALMAILLGGLASGISFTKLRSLKKKDMSPLKEALILRGMEYAPISPDSDKTVYSDLDRADMRSFLRLFDMGVLSEQEQYDLLKMLQKTTALYPSSAKIIRQQTALIRVLKKQKENSALAYCDTFVRAIKLHESHLTDATIVLHELKHHEQYDKGQFVTLSEHQGLSSLLCEAQAKGYSLVYEMREATGWPILQLFNVFKTTISQKELDAISPEVIASDERARIKYGRCEEKVTGLLMQALITPDIDTFMEKNLIIQQTRWGQSEKKWFKEQVLNWRKNYQYDIVLAQTKQWDSEMVKQFNNFYTQETGYPVDIGVVWQQNNHVKKQIRSQSGLQRS